MKQKYTISIADVDVNVVADGSQDRIEHIVGIIDRKMREILLKSRQCPKTQAALLCALDLCADKLEAKDEIARLQTDIENLNEDLKRVQEGYDRAQRTNLRLENDKNALETENARLRAIIENARLTNTVPSEDLDTFKQESTAIVCEPGETEIKNDDNAKKDTNRSRVGSMFDLLTFSDI